jgi:predicted branched-subunit amino acid permease
VAETLHSQLNILFCASCCGDGCLKWSKEERRAVIDGARALSTYSFALMAWGLVTGVAMAKSSLTTGQAVGMSLLVYGGSAQLAALPLIAGNFPLWTVLLTAAVVNMRFVIFSAALHPHFKDKPLWARAILGYLNGDLTFALFMSKYPDGNGDALTLPYYIGLAVVNWLIWQVGSLTGIGLGTVIPERWGLGFAGTLAIIAIVTPMVNHRAAIFAAGAAAIVAVTTLALPFKLNLLLAVIVAVLVGLLADRSGKPNESVGVQQ